MNKDKLKKEEVSCINVKVNFEISVIERFKIIEDYYKWLSVNEYDANSAIVFVRYKDYLLKGLEK